MTEQPRGIRLSNAEREQAVQRLQAAMSEGRITLDEFDERVARAYDARYAADLEPLFSDLPAPSGGWPAQQGISAVASGSPTLSGPTPVTDGPRPVAVIGGGYDNVAFPARPEVIDVGWSTIKRRNKWLVPGWLQIRVGPGTVVLDLREATFAQQITAIDVEVGMGAVKLLVPDGGPTVDSSRVTTGMGTISNRQPSVPEPPRPHIVCGGRVGAGSFVVREPYFGSF